MYLNVNFRHPTFNRSEVTVRTNKQTDKLTNRQTNWQTNRHRWKHPPRSAMLRRWDILQQFSIKQSLKTVESVVQIAIMNKAIVWKSFIKIYRWRNLTIVRQILLSCELRTYNTLLCGVPVYRPVSTGTYCIFSQGTARLSGPESLTVFPREDNGYIHLDTNRARCSTTLSVKTTRGELCYAWQLCQCRLQTSTVHR